MRLREENKVIISGRLKQFNAKELVKKLELNIITANIIIYTQTDRSIINTFDWNSDILQKYII